jgi:hypothetical protein
MTTSDQLDQFRSLFNPNRVYTSAEVYRAASNEGVNHTLVREGLLVDCNKVSRGRWQFKNNQTDSAVVDPPKCTVENVAVDKDPFRFVPPVDKKFTPFGNATILKKVIKSREFLPVYIHGMSGNGKTYSIEQVCARLNRNVIRFQISPETTEADLLGGFRLINGETVYQKGPVVEAMEMGAILLLDELDRGTTNSLLALQSVLEGNPVLLKKTNEVITPRRGFNVIATANTAGSGDNDGRYIGAQILDDAFLERFAITFEQDFPTQAVELRILNHHAEEYGIPSNGLTDKLAAWANIIRVTFRDGGIESVISTRRLCHILKVYSIMGNRLNCINMCITKYDADTREAFLSLYEKLDAEAAEVDGTLETPEVPSLQPE